jgi:hypothetical protein
MQKSFLFHLLLSCALSTQIPQQLDNEATLREQAFQDSLSLSVVRDAYARYLVGDANGSVEPSSSLESAESFGQVHQNSLVGVMSVVLNDITPSPSPLQASYQDDLDCAVCQNQQKNVYFEKCQHGLCFTCELRCKLNNMACPLCRGSIQVTRISNGSTITLGYGQESYSVKVLPAAGFQTTLREYQSSTQNFVRALEDVSANSTLAEIFGLVPSVEDVLFNFVGRPKDFRKHLDSSTRSPFFIQRMLLLVAPAEAKWIIKEVHHKQPIFTVFVSLMHYFGDSQGGSFKAFLEELNRHISFPWFWGPTPLAERSWWHRWNGQSITNGRLGEIVTDLTIQAKSEENVLAAILRTLGDLHHLNGHAAYLAKTREANVLNLLKTVSDQRLAHILDELNLPSKATSQEKESLPSIKFFPEIKSLQYAYSSLAHSKISNTLAEYETRWDELCKAHIKLMKLFEELATPENKRPFEETSTPDLFNFLADNLGAGPKLITDLKWFTRQLFISFQKIENEA